MYNARLSCRIFLPHVCPVTLIFSFQLGVPIWSCQALKLIIYFHLTQVLNIGT